jgi:hypothetical protein
LLSIIAVGIFMSCSNTPEPQRGTNPVSGSEAIQSAPAVQPASSDSLVPVDNQGTPLNSPPGNPLSLQGARTQVTTTPQAAQPQTAPGMNPPHGQPNHRCDIAVGAPLDSPPGKAPSSQATPTQMNTTPQAAQPQTASGMNPPHGQPNHRCDIAEGAPLDSPPGKAPVFPQTSGTSTTPESPKPADPPKAL